MNFTTHLACPENITAGLAANILSREGGTVRAANGQIVALLREASASPSRGCDVLSGPLANLLNLVSPALPLLNLGATVGFGIAALLKLGKIDERIKQVQWVVELNYAATLEVLKGVESLQSMIEGGVLADLKAAAELAANAQLLKPDSTMREHHLSSALVLATRQAHFLSDRVLEGLSKASSQLLERKVVGRNPYRDLKGEQFQDAILNLKWFRQACLALSLKAQIQAETGDLSVARNSLQAFCEKLQAVLRSCALSYFRTKTFHTYDYLVHRHWLGKIPFSRVVRLASHYDPDIPDADALIELLKGNDYKDYHSVNEYPVSWHKDVMPPLGTVFELLECATVDLDRLRGVSGELALAYDSKLTLQEYREKTKVQDVPESEHSRLVYLQVSE